MLGSVWLAIVLLILSTPPAAAKPSACPDGRFLLPEGTTVLAPASSGRQGVSLAGGTIAFDGSCGPTKARVKPGKRATKIAAPDCGTLNGKVKARKTAAVTFDAARSACGDGYADVSGGETCDLAGDEITPELLKAAFDAIAAGATDVPLSPDGTLRFVRTTTATGGTEAIVRGAATLVLWVHDGDTTTTTADQDGDGNTELRITATRAPSRTAVVQLDLDDDGVVDRTVSMVQVSSDGAQVEITDQGQSPVGFTAPLLQEAGDGVAESAALVKSENCTATEAADAETALVDALTIGLPCLKKLGMDSVGKAMAGKALKDGVTFRCGATSDCAQVDVVDSLTHGFLPFTLGINLGPAFFTGAGTCANPAMVLFHEMLHAGLGDWHSPSLDRAKKESLATDRVYSCTDMCFRPAEVTKRSCATCLGVDRCDAKCDPYPDLPGDPACGPRVEIASVSCPQQACSCCQICPAGATFRETVTGEASAPEGHWLRVNFLQSLGGQLTCGSWSSAPCPAGSTDFSCCQRQPGEPATTTFVATLPFPFQNQCICPIPPSFEAGNVVAQIVNPSIDAILEDTEPIICP